MHHRFIILVIIVSLIMGVCNAQTSLSGTIKGGDESEISLYVIDDYITGKLLLIDEYMINDDGTFSLQAHFDEVRYAVIKAGYYSAGIYLEPAAHYQLECEYEPVESFLNPNLIETPLHYTIRNEVFEGLNSNISTFNTMYDDFVMKHYATLFRSRSKSLIDNFKEDVKNQFAGFDSEYFRQYIDYRIAGMELQARTTSRADLAGKYLSGRPNYSHDEAMEFFNLFFDKYIVANSREIDRDDLQSTINYQVSYVALLDSLGKDTLLINEAMRELVMLSTLRSVLGSADYGYKQVLHIIKHIHSNSKFPEHRKIAANILDQVNELLPGALPPAITIHDKEFLFPGKKSILLCFFQSWNGACQAENVLLKEMHPEFSNRVDIIMVCADDNEASWLDWLENNNSDMWRSVWFEKDYQLLEAYRAKAFPLYVLLNPDMTIKMWDLPRPSEGMPERLKELLSN